MYIVTRSLSSPFKAGLKTQACFIFQEMRGYFILPIKDDLETATCFLFEEKSGKVLL